MRIQAFQALTERIAKMIDEADVHPGRARELFLRGMEHEIAFWDVTLRGWGPRQNATARPLTLMRWSSGQRGGGEEAGAAHVGALVDGDHVVFLDQGEVAEVAGEGRRRGVPWPGLRPRRPAGTGCGRGRPGATRPRRG